MWEALVTLPWQSRYSYKYAVVRYVEGGETQVSGGGRGSR